MNPTAKEIRENLRAAGISCEDGIPDANAAQWLSPKELDNLERKAKGKDAAAAQALVNHAAWFIRRHLPHARFNHPDDETLPTGKAILHLAKVWPQAVQNSDIVPKPLPTETEKSAELPSALPTQRKTPAYGI